MPHKRKRQAGTSTSENGRSDNAKQDSSIKRRRTGESMPRKRREDGVSRSMARMLARAAGEKPPSGLDDGEDTGKARAKSKKSSSKAQSSEDTERSPQSAVPAIMPGERLADYSARVDAALPLQGKMKKGKGPAIAGLKHPQTKTERKMQRMQAEWRLEDAKIKAKRLDDAEDLEDELDERLPGIAARQFLTGKKGAFDDPWAVVAKSRAAQEKNRGLVGIHDVVQAPPRLKPQREVVKEGKRSNGV